MMFEKQCKSGIDKQQMPSSALENPSLLSDDIPNSPAKNEKEASPDDHDKTGTNLANDSNISSGNSPMLAREQNAIETETPGKVEHESACESDSQPSKRAKINESSVSSIKSASS